MPKNRIALTGRNVASIAVERDRYEMALSGRENISYPKSEKVRALLPLDDQLPDMHVVDDSTTIELFPRDLDGSKRIAAALALFGHKFEADSENGAISRCRVYGATVKGITGFLLDQKIIEQEDFERITKIVNSNRERI